MAGSQPGAADWDTEENGPEFYSDFPEFDFSSSDPQFPTMSSPGFATSLELDAPLDNTATAPQDQESQFNLGEVDLDSMLDIFQFENQQEAGISRHPEPVPRDTPQNKPEKTDSELEEDEVTFELKKVDLLKRRRELGKLSQQEPGGQEKQIEKIREVDDELEGVELDLKTTRLRIRQKLIRKSRQSKLPQENQASSSLSTQVDPFRQSYSGGIDPSLLSTSAYNDNYYTKPPYVRLPLRVLVSTGVLTRILMIVNKHYTRWNGYHGPTLRPAGRWHGRPDYQPPFLQRLSGFD
jgi:hypothetical protein